MRSRRLRRIQLSRELNEITEEESSRARSIPLIKSCCRLVFRIIGLVFSFWCFAMRLTVVTRRCPAFDLLCMRFTLRGDVSGCSSVD